MSIVIENAVFPSQEQLSAVARGIRNPMNSWDKNDTPTWEKSGRFGLNDYGLAMRLANTGEDNRSHCKYLRMMQVIVDITAPLYFWKEASTYKVGTVRNSCSTMHRIASKEFTLDDFSHEHLKPIAEECLKSVIVKLNYYRSAYLESKSKDDWWQLIQLLPSSYNQKSTVSLNYEVLHKVYIDRRNHKLDEWQKFCNWIETIPMADLIVGEKKVNV